MNVYDFDKTIFFPDSSGCFIRYCVRHYPLAIKQNLGRILKETFRYYQSDDKDASKLKEELFRVLLYIPDPESIVRDFWNEKFCNIQPWYLARNDPSDVIISASPEFLLRPAAERLGVSFIGTEMNPASGSISGSNCSGEEKVRRYREIYGDRQIDEFYSDSLSDAPMAAIAKRAFLVNIRKGTVLPWPE